MDLEAPQKSQEGAQALPRTNKGVLTCDWKILYQKHQKRLIG